MFRILNKYRTLEVIILLLLCLFSLPYSLIFGYLLTHYMHGGQLTGIPFSIILWIYSLIIILSKKESRINIFRIINYCYVITLATYIIVMNITISILSKDEVYNLYYTPQGNMGVADYIFLSHVIIGITICVILLVRHKKRTL